MVAEQWSSSEGNMEGGCGCWSRAVQGVKLRTGIKCAERVGNKTGHGAAGVKQEFTVA